MGVLSSRVLRISLTGAIADSFLNQSSHRENTVLSEWCSFSSVRYVRGFCYVVVDFVRGAERRRISLK